MEPTKKMDFDKIEVGKFLGEKTYTVTKEDIARFAKLLGYTDPLYFDEAYAKKTEFGGIIAPPGMIFIYQLIATVDMVAAFEYFPPGSIRMGDDNEFFNPARPGDTLTLKVTISDKFIKKERKFLKARVDATNQKKEKVCTVEFACIVPL